jgi:PAS domain S-box-containing protein
LDEKFNILLIEDNPADARLIDIYLNEAYDDSFYTLTSASNLKSGLEFAASNRFDVILVDLTLPDSFGLDTFKKVFQNAQDVPIIVLTGVEDENTGLNAMKLGAQDFLIKGKVKAKGLRRSINYGIERNKLNKELYEKTKKLQEKTNDLLKEKRKLSEAQKLAHVGSWEWHINNDEIVLSDELYNIYGLTPGKFNATYGSFLSTVHEDDRAFTKKIIEESYQHQIPFNFHHRIKRPNSEIRIIHAIGEVIRDDQGNPSIMLGTGQDVTEREKEEELEKLATAATKSFNSVIIANRNGEIEWVNEGFTKFCGYTLEDIRADHKTLFELVGETNFLKDRNFNKFGFDKNPVSFERENHTRNGDKYWVITTLSPVLGSSGDVERIIAIDTDITLRKQMEEELVKANQIAEDSLRKGNKALDELINAKEQLEESMKVKEQFLANMSHEIRTPMNAIVGFTDLLLKTQLSSEQNQYVGAIKTSGKNLIVIINDILDFSKIQSGKVTFEQIEFNIHHLIATNSELLLYKSMNKKISISYNIAKEVPRLVWGDPTRLSQIIINLVGNAIKFTEKGEIKINVDLINEDAASLGLRFSISDTGIGIPKDKLQFIFEGFTQASNETTRKYGGTGLGLTIVKQLIELQGGSIEVQSTVGVGSSFIFKLRFQKNADKNEQKNELLQEEHDLTPVGNLSILLVEDNTLNQLLAKKVITNWNWQVEVAGNGLDAVRKVRENNYDVVLMDIQLPEMDGYEATSKIRMTLPSPKCTIPIIAMTAHAISGEEEKCIKAGMDGYISKPFEESILHNKIVSVYKKVKNQNLTTTNIQKDGINKP